MSDVKKKGINIKLLLFSIVIVAGIVWPVLSAIKASNPDISVKKVKITEEDLEEFKKKVAKMVESHTVRYEDKVPVVHPPVDSDIYMLARNYDWGKFILELEQGKPYRLHLASQDMPHALIVFKLRMSHKIKVGQITSVSFSPDSAGRFDILCGDYCGPRHYAMKGVMIVTPSDAVSATKEML